MRTITLLLALVATAALGTPRVAAQDHDSPVSFVRYEYQGRTSYGVLDGDRILRIEGDLYGEHALTEAVVDLSAVELLPPSEPKKVIAVGLNYRSHIGNREGSVDVEVLFPGNGSRAVTQMKDVDPAAHVGRPVTVVVAG